VGGRAQVNIEDFARVVWGGARVSVAEKVGRWDPGARVRLDALALFRVPV